MRKKKNVGKAHTHTYPRRNRASEAGARLAIDRSFHRLFISVRVFQLTFLLTAFSFWPFYFRFSYFRLLRALSVNVKAQKITHHSFAISNGKRSSALQSHIYNIYKIHIFCVCCWFWSCTSENLLFIWNNTEHKNGNLTGRNLCATVCVPYKN